MEDDASPFDEPAATAEEMLQRFEQQSLLSGVPRWLSTDPEPIEVDLLAKLHNARRLSVFDVLTWPAWAALGGPDFFGVQRFLMAVIPKLDARPDAMMRFVAALVDKGGNDGMANQPNVAFRAWLDSRLAEADEIVVLAQGGEPLAIDHLSFALQALGDLELERAIASSSTGQLRLSALTGLSRTPHPTPEDRQTTVCFLTALARSEDDDVLHASALEGILNIFEQASAVPTAEAVDGVTAALSGAGDATLYCAARALLSGGPSRTAAVISLLLEALVAVNAAHKGTMDFVNAGLSVLMDGGHGDRVIEFVTRILTRPEAPLSLADLPSVGQSLLRGPAPRLEQAVVQWLSSNEPILGRAVEALFQNTGFDEDPVILDLSAFGLADEDAYFTCTKAVGWLFTRPVTAASILVSLLGGVEEAYAQAIQELLFDPLLTSYGGVNDYLVALPPDHPAHSRVQTVIARGASYVDGLRSVGSIKEFRVSEQHRMLARTRFADDMAKATAGARKQSIFYGLVHRSTLLYGNRSISFHALAGEKPRAFEMELHPHSVSHEWPRAETLNPVGLQRLLSTLRVIRRRR